MTRCFRWSPGSPPSPAAARSIICARRRGATAAKGNCVSCSWHRPRPARGPGWTAQLDLSRALDALTGKQRLAITALKLEGRSLKEVAQETGQTVGSLKLSTHRGLASLRRLLGATEDESER